MLLLNRDVTRDVAINILPFSGGYIGAEVSK